MKNGLSAALAGLILFNVCHLFAESDSALLTTSSSWTIRGADYEFKGSTLEITEDSFKVIDRVDNGGHARKILNGEISALSIKSGLEKLYNLHNLFEENIVTPNPEQNLLIEFEGQISKIEIEHICNGRDGRYFALSAPEIYYAQNYSLKISTKEIIIKELIIGTDPSNGLMLEKDILNGYLSNYWRFFIAETGIERKVKIQGLINYAEQVSDKDNIERLELMITVIKITPS